MIVLTRRTSISRRRMLHTLSIGGAGVALAGQFPAYAMQAGRTAPKHPRCFRSTVSRAWSRSSSSSVRTKYTSNG